MEYGFYLLIFLLPWQTRLVLKEGFLNRGFWEYGTIALYATDIVLVALLVLAGIKQLKNEPPAGGEKAAIKKSLVPLAILSVLDLALFVSIFFAPDKGVAVYKYILFLLGLGLFWLSSGKFYSKAKAAWAFFVSLSIQGLLAVGQFFAQKTFAFKWLGLALHESEQPGTSAIETVAFDKVAERWLRAYGSFDHPNILGGALAVGLIALFWVILNYRREAGKKTDLKFIIYHLSFIILLSGLVFSFSRSGWLAAGAGCLILLAETLWRRERAKVIRAARVAVFSILFVSLLVAGYRDLFFTRFKSQARLELKSIAERKLYWSDAEKILPGNWLKSGGIGNYTKYVSFLEPKRPYWLVQPVHNVFFLSWIETGIFGLGALAVLILYLAAGSLRRRNFLNLSLLAALCIMMSFDHYLWSLHFGILFFWLAAGFIFKNINEAEEKYV